MSDTLKKKKKRRPTFGVWNDSGWIAVGLLFISHDSDALLFILLLLYKGFSVFIQPTIFQEMHNLIFFIFFLHVEIYVWLGGVERGRVWENGRVELFKSLQMPGTKLFFCIAVWHPFAPVAGLISSQELTLVIVIWGLMVSLCPES